MRTWIWSEGFGQGDVNPYLTMVNHSNNIATAEIKLKLDGEMPVITFHQNVQPWEKATVPLREAVKGKHFWLSVKLDQPGAATLAIWSAGYTIPPYAPPPSMIEG